MYSNVRLLGAVGFLFSMVFLFKAPSIAQDNVFQKDNVFQQEPQADVEVQTRGPVHEAYAQPFDATPEPNMAVPKAPPEPIPELPPEERPEGDNVQWIGGYWAW